MDSKDDLQTIQSPWAVWPSLCRGKTAAENKSIFGQFDQHYTHSDLETMITMLI